jgi:hypothetical protein
MKFTIKVTETIETEKEIDIPMPFYFHKQNVYAGERDSCYDNEENVWGMVYMTKDEYDNEILRVTQFKEYHREYDDDMSDARYDIDSERIDIEERRLKNWIQLKCTEEEFERESSRIFKSITNQ